jgi:HSP20 family molecular chaperone IbpA
LDFIEKDDDDGKDFVWLDISFELKRTFSTNTFWHITDTNSDNLLELDDRELEMGQRISDLQFKDVLYPSNPNKRLRKHKKAKNIKSKKVSYDYSINVVEPGNKSRIKDLDNNNIIGGPRSIMTKREDPLVDIITSESEVRLVIEMHLVNKKDIRINAYEDRVEVHATNVHGDKYYHVIDIPLDLDIGSGKATYRNGILEIIFLKRRSFKIEVR